MEILAFIMVRAKGKCMFVRSKFDECGMDVLIGTNTRTFYMQDERIILSWRYSELSGAEQTIGCRLSVKSNI